jgi:hypothetical protein
VGELKKVISFCLWGSNPKYVVGAIRNAELAKLIYPGWVCRYYIGKSTLRDAATYVDRLQDYSHVEVIKMDEEGDWRGMFWRFYPISDSDVGVMISRDTDSRLSFREKKAVDQWLRSGKKFHIIRDHPYHTFKILGGMWGARSGILRDMKSLINEFSKGDFWQVDQNFLAEIIYPRIIDDTFIHDEFREGNKFPSKRKDFEFVGDVYDEFDKRNPDLKDVLKNHIDYYKSDQHALSIFKKAINRIKYLLT